jgi:signal transduction histidine kinase
MLVTELLMLLTRIFFVLLAGLTVFDYLRHRERIRLDIALVFVALSSSIIISVVLGLFGLTTADLPLFAKIGQIGLVSQPYLLLRLVSYFRRLPKVVRWGGTIGWVFSCLIIIFAPTPLSPALSFPILIYFVVINGYAAFAFIGGAFSSAGVARHRLRFAGMASVFLLLLFTIAGIRLAMPKLWPDVTAAVQFLSMLTVITYYLGFAPPRWLRQGWQFTELRNYLLEDIPKLNDQSTSNMMVHLRRAVIHALGTELVFVALWDQDQRRLVLDNTPEASALSGFDLNRGLIQQTWQKTQPTVVTKSTMLGSDDTRLMKALDAEMLFIVPIATTEGAVGVLLAFLEYGSLFVDDDLNLLTIFAQQTAILLENFRVLEKQRHYAEVLENTVQDRTQALKRSNDELRQFAYVASHDLQEPLRMIVSYLQLIQDRYINQLDGSAHEFFDFAIDGSKRMKSLIEALLAYSRVDTQLQKFAPVDFQKVLDEVRNLLSVALTESGATVVSDPLPKINANEGMILQLFQNLLSNAIKYQKGSKPEVRIGAIHNSHEWQFSVKDNGIGIAQQNIDRIFIIFQRLHAQNEYPGTGIGLAICKKVVEHHGGRMWVESSVGQGTTFYFTIPDTPEGNNGQPPQAVPEKVKS